MAVEENTRTKPKEKKKSDGYFVVTLCQVIFTVIVLTVLFFASKTDGQFAQNIKDDFLTLMSTSFIDGDITTTLRNIGQYFKTDANVSVFNLFSKEQTEESTTETGETSFSSESVSSTTQLQETTTETSKLAEETTPLKKTSLSSGKTKAAVAKVYNIETTSVSIEKTQIVSPVSGWYSSYYGYRTNPITGNDALHTGIDIAVAEGTKIKAAYAGKVRKVGEDSRSGKYIYLTHSDGYETLYCHCSSILAKQGAVIRQGETIALVGSTGWSTGPHLHFEIHKNGERLDPLPFLNGQ